jgi:hypothetical protein
MSALIEPVNGADTAKDVADVTVLNAPASVLPMLQTQG